jgi:hypothetical protein
LNSWPRQKLANAKAKNETRESHFMFLGVQKNVKEWTHTFHKGFPLWELDSSWTPKFSKGDCKNQNSLDWRIPYTIGKILRHKYLKWASMTHLGNLKISYG